MRSASWADDVAGGGALMRFDGATIFAVHVRLRDLARRPRLFNDRMPPARVARRLRRFQRWCGPTLWWVLVDHEHRRTQPAADVIRWRH